MSHSQSKQSKKDYILNIRISRDTFDKIKNRASENKETISSLLRKVIDDSSEIIGDLSNEIFDTRKKGKANNVPDIACFYSAKTAKAVTCQKCKKSIKKGTKVEIGEDAKGQKYFFCETCKQC